MMVLLYRYADRQIVDDGDHFAQVLGEQPVEQHLATKGHPAVLNFSTTPQWMWITPKPVAYPADPEEPVWNYTQGAELRDPSGQELAAYYARLVGWYTLGGFVDEYGKRHESGHHYQVD